MLLKGTLAVCEATHARVPSQHAADVQKLRDAGFNEPQNAEAVYIAAMFAFFNRVANGFGLDDPKYCERQIGRRSRISAGVPLGIR